MIIIIPLRKLIRCLGVQVFQVWEEEEVGEEEVTWEARLPWSAIMVNNLLICPPLGLLVQLQIVKIALSEGEGVERAPYREAVLVMDPLLSGKDRDRCHSEVVQEEGKVEQRLPPGTEVHKTAEGREVEVLEGAGPVVVLVLASMVEKSKGKVMDNP